MDNGLIRLYRQIQAASAVTVGLPDHIGTGSITRTVTPCGTALSSWKMKYGQDTSVEGKNGDDFRILFCMGDGAEWISDGKPMNIDRNEILMILSDGEAETMCYPQGSDFEFWSVSLPRMRLIDTLSDYMPDPQLFVSDLKYRRIAFTPEIRGVLADSFYFLKKADRGFGMMRLEAQIQEILAVCFDAAAGEEYKIKGIHADDIKILEQIKARIDTTPGEMPGIEQVAREYGMSVSKLTRLFRQMYAIPLHAYVIESRLCEGARLLAEGGLSVGEVSRRVGYVKQSQFTQAFKRRFHVLPSDF